MGFANSILQGHITAQEKITQEAARVLQFPETWAETGVMLNRFSNQSLDSNSYHHLSIQCSVGKYNFINDFEIRKVKSEV